MSAFMNNLRRIDGRYFLGGSHLTLLVICVFIYDLQRTPFQIFSAYFAAFIVETIFYFSSKKNRHRPFRDSLFSAATEAIGLLILVRSSFQYAYIVFSVLAVSSKYVLRLDERRHMFNPTNIAIVVGLVLIPRVYFEVRPDEFSQNLYPVFHVLAFGLFAITFSGSWPITVAFLTTAISISGIYAFFSNESFVYLIGPELGSLGLIFMFLMITDPRTTPVTIKGKLFFGFCVAALLYLFRSFEVFYAHYIALFCVTFGRGFYEIFKQHESREKNPSHQVELFNQS